MFLPRTKWYATLNGVNANNTVFLIKMRRGMNAGASKAVWAQEFYESRFKSNPINLIKRLTSTSVRRKMELMSHEIEVRQFKKSFPKSDTAEYRRAEARVLKRGYDGIFSSWSIDAVYAAMRSNGKEALAFIDKYEKQINKYGVE